MATTQTMRFASNTVASTVPESAPYFNQAVTSSIPATHTPLHENIDLESGSTSQASKDALSL